MLSTSVSKSSVGSVSTISRSCSCRANASSLLSMQEAAATSRGVEPRIPEKSNAKHGGQSAAGTSARLNATGGKVTEADAAVLQEVAEVVKHGALVLPADATEVAKKTAAVCHHSRKSDLLSRREGTNNK